MTRKRKDVDPGTVPEPNAEEQELVDARNARMRLLIDQQRRLAEINREQAAEQQRKFGTGDQG